MNLNFGTPEHGWMIIQLNNIEFDVSNAHRDSLFDLVTILSRVLSGSQSETIDWFLEPEYAQWKFQKTENEIEFLIKATSNSDEILIEADSPKSIVKQITKALTRLSRNPCWENKEQAHYIWSWPFPFTELERLRSQLNQKPGT